MTETIKINRLLTCLTISTRELAISLIIIKVFISVFGVVGMNLGSIPNMIKPSEIVRCP